MSGYDEEIEQLTRHIYELKILRDAQRDGSQHWEHYQDEISSRTTQLRAWQQAVPELDKLDQAIRFADSAARSAQRDANTAMDNVWRAAKVFGTLGIVFLLVTVTWDPSLWCPVLTFVFLAAAVGAIVYGTRIRQGRYEAVDEANGKLAGLVARRDARIPAAPAARQVAPASSLRLVDVHELDPVMAGGSEDAS